MPFASTSIARSTQRDALEGPAPFSCGASPSPGLACSHTLTVRSNDPDARTVPNSGCAQLTLEMDASWACQSGVYDDERRVLVEGQAAHLPVVLYVPSPASLVKSPNLDPSGHNARQYCKYNPRAQRRCHLWSRLQVARRRP